MPLVSTWDSAGPWGPRTTHVSSSEPLWVGGDRVTQILGDEAGLDFFFSGTAVGGLPLFVKGLASSSCQGEIRDKGETQDGVVKVLGRGPEGGRALGFPSCAPSSVISVFLGSSGFCLQKHVFPIFLAV